MSWQALTVVVDKAGHGAVESALEEAGALAVTTEDAADEPVLEPGIGETPLWPHLRVTGLFESGCERQAIHRQLAALDAVAQAEQLSWQTLEDQDWTRAWMDRFEPMDFGHGLWICPRGQTVPTDAQHVIELDPGLAFGTGTHPTTALCLAALDGKLDQTEIQWDPRPTLGVVMAAGGYPDSYPKGDVIEGLDQADSDTVKVFHAGTAEKDGQVVTSGGRVLCVTGVGDTVSEAQANAYQGVKQITWSNAQYRSDIGYRAVAREKA